LKCTFDENYLHNQWLTTYFLAPLYAPIVDWLQKFCGALWIGQSPIYTAMTVHIFSSAHTEQMSSKYSQKCFDLIFQQHFSEIAYHTFNLSTWSICNTCYRMCNFGNPI